MADWHSEIVSGRSRGPVSATARGLLRAAAFPYERAVRALGASYDAGRRTVHAAPLPVLSVGNLTAGGTGKTPMTAFFANALASVGHRVAIVSRGYRPLPGDPLGRNDESLVLESLCPTAVQIVSRDRVAGARRAAEDFGATVVLLDDGFQHRRLIRDLDVVLLDATEPFGFERLLPAGRLREPLEALRRADLAIVTRAELVSPEQIETVTARVAEVAPHVPVATVAFEPRWADGIAPAGRIGAFCGIGNPDGFFGTVAALGAMPVAFETFPDHHRYRRADLKRLAAVARGAGLDAWASTRKDAVKLDPFAPPFDRTPLRVVDQAVSVVAGEEFVKRALAGFAVAGLRRAA